MPSANCDEELVDITELIRRCSSQCLSHPHPFTPLAKNDAAALLGNESKDVDRGGEDGRGICDVVTDGTLLAGLHVRGPPHDGKSKNNNVINEEADDARHERRTAPKLIPLDLLDAMTALEIGDKRMDCCEIPLHRDSTLQPDDEDKTSSPPKPSFDPNVVTFPPRIAPTSLSDGTPCASLPTANGTPENATSFSETLPDDAIILPTSPCLSLLPHWNNLHLSSSATSTSSLVPLLMLQLTALEAYIGTNNGGSNAAETLYCMMWFHDGVLMDMSERLSVNIGDSCNVNAGVTNLERYGDFRTDGRDAAGDETDELTVARWTLFASSLGVVRIAEAVRCAVVNADFYEEEDFGVTLHGGKVVIDHVGEQQKDEDEGGSMIIGEITNNTEGTKKGGCPSSMRFCPALQGSQYIEVVWDTALSYLRRYRSFCIAKGSVDMDKLNPTIDALETILCLQQSFFQAIKILSNLNDETVRDFTKIAAKRSRETVSLFEALRDNDSVAELSRDGLVGPDGRLIQKIRYQPELNLLLAASFDPFVNRRLLGNAPVRKACFRRPLHVVTSLLQLAAEMEWGVCDPILYGNTLGRITRMLEKNSLRGCGGSVPLSNPNNESSFKEEVLERETSVGMNILSRSLIVLNLYFDDKLFGQYDFGDMIGQHMRQQCAVPELLIQDGVWSTRLAKPMYDTLKSLCLNRHRERGFTETILLPAFQVLQYEATTVDEKFKVEHELDPKTTPSYATNYVILNTIRLMERHVGLGIELGLYPNWYDLSTALWYRDFLLSALINVRGSIERERMQRREMDLRIKLEEEEEERKAKTQLLQQSKKKGKTKKTKKSSKLLASPSPTTSALTAESAVKTTEEDFEDRLDYTSLLLHRNLCRGLVRYIAALRQAELLCDPPASITMFTTHQKRFEKRFEAFSTLYQPPSLSYEDYVRGSDFSSVQSKDLLSSSTDCFRSGKGIVDWLLNVVVVESCDGSTIDKTDKRKDDDLYISIRREEIMALAKVCVTNSLFLHKLASAKAGQKNASTSVAVEFKAHKQYCTISIT